jgi:predicted DNA-binding ribbon-helix-helix protein
MKSSVVKRSVLLTATKTSVSLEGAFWNALKEIAAAQDITLQELVTKIEKERQDSNLSSAIRVFVLSHYIRENDTQA